ncbi:hypothetical protein AA313_de0201067 [Arthrobotrys entomopaga]|nr:hypothetical protein AA313_de0201067 [Arthrobotrys entomopaga]
MSDPEIDIPSRKDVEAACRAKGNDTNILWWSDQIVVKFCWTATIAEALMQQWVHCHADQSIFYTPKVYDCWREDRNAYNRYTYIVMERLRGKTIQDWMKTNPTEKETEAAKVKILKAIRHLWDLPVPLGTFVGPLGNQPPSDRFFGFNDVDRTFDSTEELETWINGLLIKGGGRGKPVSFRSQPRQLCHGDLTDYNIMIDDEGRIMIIDWGFADIYPRIFEEWGLVHAATSGGIPGKSTREFCKSLYRELFGREIIKRNTVSPTILSFSYAMGCIQFRHLGLSSRNR